MQSRFFLVLLLFAPAILFAQEPSKLRNAGSAKAFRVITSDDVASASKSPYSDAFQTAFSSRDWKAASDALPEKPAKYPYDLLWGTTHLRAAKEADDPSLAWRAYSALKNGSEIETPLRDYYQVYGASAAIVAEKYDHAAELAGRVDRKSRLHAMATYLFAEALFLNGNIDRGRRALAAATKLYPKSTHRISAMWTAAQVEPDAVRAGELAKEILISSPNSKFEGEIRQWLRKYKVRMPDNSVDDLLRKYGALFRAHRSEQIVKELPNRMRIAKAGSKDWCELSYFVARSYTKLRQHPDAIKAYKPILERCSKKGDPYLKGLYQTGRSLWNSGDPKAALKVFEKLAKTFPDHSYADDAYNYQVRILRELGRHKEANARAKKQLKLYPEGDMAPDAKWFSFRREFAKGRYDKAIKIADGFDDRGDVYSGGRLTYFAARAAQLAGNSDDATGRYQRVIKEFPASYYALLAVNRLGELNKTTAQDLCGDKANCPFFAATFPAIEVPDDVKNDARFKRGTLLSEIGLDDAAKGEFLALRGSVSGNDRWALAKALHDSGAYPYSHDLARRHLGDWENTFPSDHERWEIAYPTPFKDLVTKAHGRHKIDTAIIYAIMREESGFNPRVLSWAGAHGLLQLMPDTARKTAKLTNTPYKGRSSLFDADVAVDIGTGYMADLAQQGGGHPVLVIAGYNGGWGSVARWLKELPVADLDLWVEDITYGQTRKYTKRVLRSYWIYKMREGVLGPKLKMRVR